MSDDETPTVTIRVHSAAIDEIYRLRTLLAWESALLELHTSYVSFPKRRLPFAQESIERMRAAARGNPDAQTLQSKSNAAVRQARDDAGMSQTLTNSQWERQNGLTEDTA